MDQLLKLMHVLSLMNTKCNIPFNIVLDLRAGTGAPYAVEVTKNDRDHLLDGTLAQSGIIS